MQVRGPYKSHHGELTDRSAPSRWPADIGRVVLHGHLRRCLEGTDRFSSSEGWALMRCGLLAPPEVGPMVAQAVPVTSSTVVVAVDVGKTEFAFSVTDSTRGCFSNHERGVR